MSLADRKARAVSQPTAAPTNKTLAGVISGGLAAVATLLFQHYTGLEFPPGVEGAIGTTVYGVIAWLVPDTATVTVVVQDPR